MLERANLHNDPLRHVLEYMDGQIDRLELLAAREPMPAAELERITRAAAIGANAQAVAMIQAAYRRTCLTMLAIYIASIVAAALLGYSVH